MRRRNHVTATGVTVTKNGRFLQRTIAKLDTTVKKSQNNRNVATYTFFLYNDDKHCGTSSKRVVRGGDCIGSGD